MPAGDYNIRKIPVIQNGATGPASMSRFFSFLILFLLNSLWVSWQTHSVTQNASSHRLFRWRAVCSRGGVREDEHWMLPFGFFPPPPPHLHLPLWFLKGRFFVWKAFVINSKMFFNHRILIIASGSVTGIPPHNGWTQTHMAEPQFWSRSAWVFVQPPARCVTLANYVNSLCLSFTCTVGEITVPSF